MLWGRQVAGRNYPPTNKNTLTRALTKEWDKLPQQLLDNVVQNMPLLEAGLFLEHLNMADYNLYWVLLASKKSYSETELKIATLATIATRGLLATDHVILNHGQVTWTTPELTPPLPTTTPHQQKDVRALNRFNVHCSSTQRVFRGTGLKLVTKPVTIRYLDHSATVARLCEWKKFDFFNGKSELIAIEKGHNYIDNLAEPNLKCIWILIGSCSSIQHLSNWKKILSHVGNIVNEITDSLAKAASLDTKEPDVPSTFSEVFSDSKKKQGDIWTVPPEHVWYPRKCLWWCPTFLLLKVIEASRLAHFNLPVDT
ncbi:uncharacterized protein TNCV_1550851 [Trichonephila clavipes]|nr:uncharacterized protein TNCV_1550851 [Trichonephila clavipes]